MLNINVIFSCCKLFIKYYHCIFVWEKNVLEKFMHYPERSAHFPKGTELSPALNSNAP